MSFGIKNNSSITKVDNNYSIQPDSGKPQIVKAPEGSGWGSNKFLYVSLVGPGGDPFEAENIYLFYSDNGVTWESILVYSSDQLGGAVFTQGSVVVDSDANVIIMCRALIIGEVHADRLSKKLAITFNGTSWVGQTFTGNEALFEPLGGVGGMQVCIDASNVVHMYYHYIYREEEATQYSGIAHTTFDGVSTWADNFIIQDLYTDANNNQYVLSNAKMDSNGKYHLFYTISPIVASTPGDLSLYYLSDVDNVVTTIDTDETYLRPTDLNLDVSGNVHFMWLNSTDTWYNNKDTGNVFGTPIAMGYTPVPGYPPSVDGKILKLLDDSIVVIITTIAVPKSFFFFYSKASLGDSFSDPLTLGSQPSSAFYGGRCVINSIDQFDSASLFYTIGDLDEPGS